MALRAASAIARGGGRSVAAAAVVGAGRGLRTASGAVAASGTGGGGSGDVSAAGGMELRLGDERRQMQVRLRPLRLPDDLSVVVPLWQSGFAEMGPHVYARAIGGRRALFLAVGAALCLGLLVVGARRAFLPALLVVGAVATPCLGERVVMALLWLGIYAQTWATMRSGNARMWLKPNHSNFIVAEVTAPPATHSGGGSGDSSGPATTTIGGCVAVRMTHTLHAERRRGVATVGDEASVWRLTVAPSLRGTGLGRTLMAAAEAWAAGLGAAHISLITGNPESRRFYQRIGYTSETMPRAVRVVFGDGASEGAIASCGWGPLAWLKLQRLRGRLGANGTVLVRELVAPAAPSEKEPGGAGALPVVTGAAVAATATVG